MKQGASFVAGVLVLYLLWSGKAKATWKAITS